MKASVRRRRGPPVVLLAVGWVAAGLAIVPPALADELIGPTVPDGAACQLAIKAAERGQKLPGQLLGAIGVVESGRISPETGRVAPWPWTINVAGTGHFFDTKEQAVAAVQGYQAAGTQSIDVGCMQVNLSYHPRAFATLAQAFDPMTNAAYAADFLMRLFVQTRDWSTAAAFYHSQTPGISDGYARRVMVSWPLASRYVDQSVLAAVMAGPAATPAPGGCSRPPDLRNYTPELRRVIAQASMDRARLLAEMRPAGRPGLAGDVTCVDKPKPRPPGGRVDVLLGPRGMIVRQSG